MPASSSGVRSSRWRFSMIEISRAVSSSISSTSAGIVSRPASRDARQRRSPATSWYRFSPSGRTRIGWRTPCSRIDADSSWSASGSKTRRGWSGFGSIRSTGMVRTPTLRPTLSELKRLTIAGESSRSSERRRAAAARKSGLAKVDDLPSELAIGPGRVRRAGIGRDRSSGKRRLAELDGVPDDAAEDVVIADDPQLVQHVAGEVRPAVEERRQQPEDPEIAVQLHPDHVDDLDEVVQTLHRVVLGLDGDDHAVRGDEPVDRQEPEVRRAVDEDVV